jgi:hypothetical protein
MKSSQQVALREDIIKNKSTDIITLLGRILAPPPIRISTNGKAKQDSLKADEWLRKEAINEARLRRDKFNLFQFEQAIDPKKMTQAEKEGLHIYLFGEIKNIFKLID